MSQSQNEPIIVEQSFRQPSERVWKAITDHGEMIRWFFDNIPAFEPVRGFETSFTLQSGDRSFEHLWKVLKVVRGKKIVCRWRYTEYEGEGRVSFELISRGRETMLRITNEGLESFPQDIPEFSRESCRAGWEYIIQEKLKEYLES